MKSQVKVFQKEQFSFMSNNYVLQITAKCDDRFNATLLKDDQMVKEYDGYVPSLVPNLYGDYVNLDIDVQTGKILNWVIPTEDQIQEFINA